MTRRFLVFVAAISLLATSCGGGETSAQGALVARPLAYSLNDNVALDYHVDLDMMMTTNFGDSFTRFDPSAPSLMETSMEMSFDSRYQVTPGEEPGSYRVSVAFDNMKFGKGKVEMGRESFDFSDLPQSELDEVLDAQIVEVAYNIDDQGKILSMEIGGQTIDVGGMLNGTTTAAANNGQMFGPELPEGEVEIGDTWTTTAEEQLPGMDPIITEQKHTIIRSEEHSGYQTWVIKTDSSTGAFTITWDDLLAMADELGGLSTIGVDESMPPAFQMSMRSAPSGATMITWFEPELGLTIAQDVTANIAMTMEMAGLPNTGGRAVTMDMDGYTHTLMELIP